MQQRFLQALVGILVLHILAHQPDGDFVARILHALQHGGPARKVARRRVDLQQAQDDIVHAFGGERDRHFVDRFHVARGDHRFQVHVAEQRDLFLHLLRNEALRAAEQDIRLDTDGAQFLHAVLRGLGLQFLRGGDPRHQRHVHEQAVAAPLFVAHLADGFQERQRFDIAHGAADFGDHHVHVRRHLLHGGLDFVGDVRNHLHGLAQIVAAPLARDDLLVDAAGGQVVALRELACVKRS